MINIQNKQDCCGCSACVQRCPKQCISLHEDEEGFLYPVVDKDTCIDCGLCEKVCPVLHPYDNRLPLHTYAAINTNEEIRMQSSSGGIFTLLAEKILDEGGVVFGARFDEHWQVTLDYTETKEGLTAFRGSKYVQARTGDTYQQCEDFLKTGRKVMYSGSSCQVAGLKHFLRKEYENLLVVDFVCHGVPSPKIWGKYLDEIIGVANVKNVSMRDKCRGWARFSFVTTYNKADKIITLSSYFAENIYMRAFLNNMIIRPSCYECPAKSGKSNADVTIADYWGIGGVAPEMNDDKGVSLVMVNTVRGADYLSQLHCKMKETSFESAHRSNPAISTSAKRWYKREEFFSRLHETDSVSELMRDCLRLPFKEQLKKDMRTCKSNIKAVIRILLVTLHLWPKNRIRG